MRRAKNVWLKTFGCSLLVFEESAISAYFLHYLYTKIQQTKILVTCQMFGVLFLFGLVWQYSTNQKQYNVEQVQNHSYLLATVNMNLSLPSSTVSALQRELNFHNCYLSLLYFCFYILWIGQENFQFSITYYCTEKLEK